MAQLYHENNNSNSATQISGIGVSGSSNCRRTEKTIDAEHRGGNQLLDKGKLSPAAIFG
jgi:hypothetical protein